MKNNINIVFERWECNVCGLPCRVEIVADNAGGMDKPRFVNRACPCKEDTPEWKRICPSS